jgi:uncharacterized protein (TIGR03083 family)
MSEHPYDAAWLPGDAYDALRASDFERFCDAAGRDLTAHVPTCPEWDVTGLCDHLARVYQGRSHAIEHAAFLDRDAFELRAEGEDPLAHLRRWSDELDRSLLDRGDDAPTVTFIPEARTVHFWRRRMALETLVHRTDAELAVGEVSPMDDVLSADGVDELLWFLTYESDDEPHDDDAADGERAVAATSTVLLTDGNRTWFVTLGPGESSVGHEPAPADATVTGSAAALLLSLSGRDLDGLGPARFGVRALELEGDPAAYERLRARLGAF